MTNHQYQLPKTNHLQCHCGSLVSFEQCCGQFIELSKLPKTAEQLMRSRFTAFKLRKYQYLIDTHQTETTNKLNSFDSKLEWLGLRIISTDRGKPSDISGTVEFIAFYQQGKESDDDKFEQLHEKSNFKKLNDRWMYIDGKPLPEIKLARNEHCFCDSGKKYKKCHGV